MRSSNSEIEAFLKGTAWETAKKMPITGDASDRRYTRLSFPNGNQVAVLMDARLVAPDSTKSFLAITEFLLTNGYSAPQIYTKNKQGTLLLIEDLGHDLFALISQSNPEMERTVYTGAIELLASLRNCTPPPFLDNYTGNTMALAIDPLFEFYADNSDGKAEIISELEKCLESFCTGSPVIALRDFHAENLLWLPRRDGVKKVGLIDYQDAVLAHPAYDLASLLRDVRRDVSPELVELLLTKYINATAENPDSFRAAFAIQSVQRNLRILGIFAKLCIISEKQSYVALIPRVWQNLLLDLSHPALAKLNALIMSAIPAPTSEKLDRLRLLCKTNHAQ